MAELENKAPGTGSALLYSVIMPAYNEEAVIEATLTSLTGHLDAEGFRYEVIVINDNSTDETAAVIDAAARDCAHIQRIDNDGPGGYGNAVRCGIAHYKGDAAVIVTADGSDAPKDVAAYFRKIEEGFDCAFGSRFLPGATVKDYPPFKLFMNRIANRLIGLILGSKYNDFTNGFKCYRRCVIDDMQPLIAGQFNITIELVVKAILGGWRYEIVPTDWTQRDAGQSSFKLVKLLKPYAATFLYCLTANYIKNVKR